MNTAEEAQKKSCTYFSLLVIAQLASEKSQTTESHKNDNLTIKITMAGVTRHLVAQAQSAYGR